MNDVWVSIHAGKSMLGLEKIYFILFNFWIVKGVINFMFGSVVAVAF